MIQGFFKRSLMTSSIIYNQVPHSETRPDATPANILKRNFEEVKLPKTRFGPNLFRISVAYVAIIAIGISTFYLAKKEVDQNRQETMKIKQQIADATEKSTQYPSRSELLKAEREREAALKKQN
ncbi:unnamed protein product [Brachionus calyciflorus]|uniref:Uncharacterized protein n=1 Tax=Brachionus calyciflorus TaxID=104777 RepID=A0A813Y044_9BILA|nr:unnamed protein product [Brachionus calyciflorus]